MEEIMPDTQVVHCVTHLRLFLLLGDQGTLDNQSSSTVVLSWNIKRGVLLTTCRVCNARGTQPLFPRLPLVRPDVFPSQSWTPSESFPSNFDKWHVALEKGLRVTLPGAPFEERHPDRVCLQKGFVGLHLGHGDPTIPSHIRWDQGQCRSL